MGQAPAGKVGEVLEAVEQIASLPAREAVERFLEKRPELLRSNVVVALADEVPRLLHTALGHAERLSEAATWLAARLDVAAQARARRTAAHVLYARGEHEAAATAYDEARALYEQLGDEKELGRTLSSSLQALIYLGRYTQAEAQAERARTIFEGLSDRLRLARLDTNVANLHYRRDRFGQALALYERAQAALREVGTPNDVAVTLRNMAVCHISLNDFAQALAVHREARAFSESHGLARLVVEADYNIAYLHYLRGEYTVALELYQAARAQAEALGDAYHRALCDLDQSELYLELNLLDEGVALAEQALAGFEALRMRYETAKALTNLAVGVGRQGEALRSLQLFARAREMFVAEGNDFWPALIDIYRGLVLHQEGRHFEARKLGQDALRFFDAVGQPSRAALAELVLARIHLAVGELVSARVRCQRALARLQGGSAPELSHRAHFLLGQAEEALGSRTAALAAYEAARDRLENLRSHLEQDELKIGFLKDKLAVYESLVVLRVAGRQGPADTEQAFTCIEQAKSRSLADLLAFRATALPASSRVRSSFVEQVHGLRQELNWYYRTIDLAEVGREPRSPAHLESLRRESREREAELLRLLREAGGRDPEFASLQSGRSVDLESIRSTLPSDTTVLEFYLARGMLLAAILTGRDLAIVPVSPASRVRHELQLLRFQLSKFRLGDSYVRAFEPALRDATAAHLQKLYGDLIGPVRERLRTRRLLVVPHDFLHYVPFHALLDGPRALIDEFVVTYAPSASVHHLCCAKAAAGEGSLVMGVPDAATPHIVHEVTEVARSLPDPRVFVGEEATETALRTHGATSRFVHLATHGRFRHDNPMFSSVQLGTSRLSLFDLYQLDLPAELVTLSGCGTGLNVAEGGDELLGLVRGLLYAGTQSALVTLWDVNDLSTSEFMSRFYRHLREAPHDKGIALQQAMRELRESHPHPYYWAPFVMVGRGA
jgi:CHAT domain-containing protein